MGLVTGHAAVAAVGGGGAAGGVTDDGSAGGVACGAPEGVPAQPIRNMSSTDKVDSRVSKCIGTSSAAARRRIHPSPS